MKSDLGIVIVNWNSKEELIRCLESVEKAGFIRNVVVVDNGSDKKLKAQSSKLKVKVIENNKNFGFGGGNNVGISYLLKSSSRHARTIKSQRLRYILILNPDTEIYKDTIPNLLKVMEGDEMIGIVGPKILLPSPLGSHGLRSHSSLPPQGWFDLRIWSAGGIIDKKRYSGGLIGIGEVDHGQYRDVKEVDFISGTAMLVRSEVFERTGFFSDSYFMYYEDVEFCLRAKKAGYRVIYVPTAKILHHESSSIGKNSPAQEYYMARNHLLFVERNAPILIRIRESIRLAKTIYEHWQKGERWAIRGIGDYFLRRFGKRDNF